MLLKNLLKSLRVSNPVYTSVRTATKKTSGTSGSSHNSAGRRLGVKKHENHFVTPGQIIWRQRGTAFFPGENCGIGRDHTIFALEPGYVRFYRDPYHAQRRLIGVALKKEYSLPTPHFEPRRRRFGYTLVTDPETAEYEAKYLTRKETHRQKALEKKAPLEQEFYNTKIAEFQKACQSANLELGEDELARLFRIREFMKVGGIPYSEAVNVVNKIISEEMDLAVYAKTVSDAENKTKKEEFFKQATKTDATVQFSASGELVPASALSAETKQKVIDELEALTTDFKEFTPQETVSKVIKLIDSTPGFSLSEARELKDKYVRLERPVLVTSENKAEIEKRVAAKEGSIKPVNIDNTVTDYFIPKKSDLVF